MDFRSYGHGCVKSDEPMDCGYDPARAAMINTDRRAASTEVRTPGVRMAVEELAHEVNLMREATHQAVDRIVPILAPTPSGPARDPERAIAGYSCPLAETIGGFAAQVREARVVLENAIHAIDL